MSMWSEILEQPGAVRAMLAANRGHAEALAGLMAGDVTHAVVAARGTSDNAARYAQYVWGSRNRLAVGLTTPSLFGPYATPPGLRGALVVAISQSGESPDIAAVLAEGRRQGRPTVALTNHPGSPLAALADLVVDLAAGEERAVAATKTYTTELAAVAFCSLALGRADPALLEAVPGLLDRVLASSNAIAAAVAHLVGADRCVVLARGYHHATAFEWAHKMQETCYLIAQPYSAADFAHGPRAVVQEGLPVLLVATRGPMLEPLRRLAAELASQRARVIAMTSDPAFPADALVTLPDVDEWLAPIVAAPALQLFCHHLARARGLDPDAPRGLTKVTRTT